MALKIRCTGCHKKISVDEAFAGGVCRCPYCKELVMVPGELGGGDAGGRPESPNARPESPDAIVPSTMEQAVEAPEHVPVARPVMLQGIVTIIVLILIAVSLIGGTILLVHIMQMSESETMTPDGGGGEVLSPTAPVVNPIAPPSENVSGAVVAGKISIEAPVIYCIDGGGNMGQMYYGAVMMAAVSAGTVPADRTVDAWVCLEGRVEKLAESPLPGGRETAKTIKDRGMTLGLDGKTGGATDLAAAITVAIEAKPKTVVVFMGDKSLPEAADICSQASVAGVRLVAVGIGSTSAKKQIQEMVGEAGKAVFFTRGEMASFMDNAPLPD